MRGVLIAIFISSCTFCNAQKSNAQKCKVEIYLLNKYIRSFDTTYKTGIDNYRVEIKYRGQLGIEDLFEFYINDGIFTTNTLRTIITDDTVFISTNYPTIEQTAKTKAGMVVFMQKSH